MTTTRVRRARKQHQACGGYCRPIAPGELYVEHVAFPGDDGAEEIKTPWRIQVCAACARLAGQGPLLDAAALSPPPATLETRPRPEEIP